MPDPENLRIHFYGVQGSGSIFPTLGQRLAAQEVAELDLLEHVFADLQRHQQRAPGSQVDLEALIGGPLSRHQLRSYRGRFDVPELRVYGGWTTCFRVETADGFDIILDCGSGFRVCAQHLMQKWTEQGREERQLHILGSHSHYDHTEGFDQAVVCFDPRNDIHIWSNRQYLKALDQNLGIFSHHVESQMLGVVTPLNYRLMPARFTSHEVCTAAARSPEDDPLVHRFHDVSEPIVFGETVIQPIEVFHPAPCLAYRFERAGKVFVFCTDHELRHGDDPDHPLQQASEAAEARLREYSMDADVLYRDGQYLRVEYDGLQGIGAPAGISRVDWGHSCIEDVLEMAEACNIGRTYIGHHDPGRDWSERNWFDETLARKSEQTGLHFELAQAETVIDL